LGEKTGHLGRGNWEFLCVKWGILGERNEDFWAREIRDYCMETDESLIRFFFAKW
jgi:hypothetical protein